MEILEIFDIKSQLHSCQDKGMSSWTPKRTISGHQGDGLLLNQLKVWNS